MAELTSAWSMLKEVYVGRCNAGYLYVRAYARLVSQNIEKNQSTVAYNISTNYTNSDCAYDAAGQVAVSGTGLSWQYRGVTRVTRGENSWITKEVTVNHNADGTASISASGWIKFPNWNYNGTTATGYATLPTIPRKANLTSAPNFNDEENPTIYYNNPAGNAVNALDVCIGWTGGDDIKYRSVPKTGSSYTFNFTESERNVLRNACSNSNSRSVTFYLRTTIGNTVEYSTISKTFSISNGNPVITSISVVDTIAENAALTGSNTKIIKGFNDVRATMTCKAKAGATIKDQTVSNSNMTAYGNSIMVSMCEDPTFTFTVRDSRGNTTTKVHTIQMVNYVKLTVNLQKVTTDAGGKLVFNISGNYFNASFGATNNSLKVQYRYKVNGGSYGNWTDTSVGLKGNTYSKNIQLDGLDYTKDYIIQARAIDKIYTNGISTNEVNMKIVPVFDWGANDFNFNVPVKVGGNLVVNDSGSSTYIKTGGRSSSWINGRDNAMLRQSTLNGYSPMASIKTKNGSWEIGAYDNNSFIDQLCMTYIKDSDHDSGNNTISSQVILYPDGRITSKLGTIMTDQTIPDTGHYIFKAKVGSPQPNLQNGTVPFNTVEISSSKFTLSGNRITVGEGVSAVRITAKIGGSAGSSGRGWAHLYVGNNWVNYDLAYGAFPVLTVDAIAYVYPGIQIRVDVSEFNGISVAGLNSYIMVERIG